MSECRHRNQTVYDDGSVGCDSCGEELRSAVEASELQAAYDDFWGQ